MLTIDYLGKENLQKKPCKDCSLQVDPLKCLRIENSIRSFVYLIQQNQRQFVISCYWNENACRYFYPQANVRSVKNYMRLEFFLLIKIFKNKKACKDFSLQASSKGFFRSLLNLYMTISFN